MCSTSNFPLRRSRPSMPSTRAKTDGVDRTPTPSSGSPDCGGLQLLQDLFGSVCQGCEELEIMMNFDGQAVIVTGAASGIGLGIARAFHGAGASVVLGDLHEDALR